MRTSTALFLVIMLAVSTVGLTAGTLLAFSEYGVGLGTVSVQPGQSITVIGTAKQDTLNQVARFDVGVSKRNQSKETAVAEVNAEIAKLVDAIKGFGIAPADIQTSNMSINQNDDPYSGRPTEWYVNNSVSIKLRDIDRSKELADVLAASGATNFYGPNFSIDDTEGLESQLFEAAIMDARTKAQNMAQASGRELGEVLQVTEGGAGTPVYPMMANREMGGGGGGAVVEPGSSQVSQSVTVTFSLR